MLTIKEGKAMPAETIPITSSVLLIISLFSLYPIENLINAINKRPKALITNAL